MSAEPELVVLLHGLSPLPFSLRQLETGLRAAGFRTRMWRYPSRRHDVAALVRQFRARLVELEGVEGRVHFVGFSLGAILIRAGLVEPVRFRVGRIVMIAPPNHGSGLVARLRHLTWLRHIFGRPSAELARGEPWLERLATPPYEIGIIAGTRLLHLCNPNSWLNWLLGNRRGHDGTVEIESTKLAGMRDFALVDATHTLIAAHPESIRQTISFLRQGSFQQAAAAAPVAR